MAPVAANLKLTGCGVPGPGKLMFGSEGNASTANHLQDGGQIQDVLWDGGHSKSAPNGKQLSPAVTGFTDGGIFGRRFGLTLDAQERVWAISLKVGNRSRLRTATTSTASLCTGRASTLGGGQGVVVFFGMAKSVRTPLIGPPRWPQTLTKRWPTE